ncbi:MAG: cytochrome c [Candidatus Eremiobacteraeota bacterium]|nr:cytochrome c [Candidatus Eremiobacteraeota bacterium]
MNRTLPALLVVAAFGLTLTGCNKSESSNTTTTTSEATAAPAAGATTNAMAAGNASTGNGQQVFSQNCSSCHQTAGTGNAVFPPLAHNPVVTGDSKKVITIVKDGLTGKVSVLGKSYNGQMPAWKTQLSDGDIAAVVTYIRSAWGNHASAVTTPQVAAVK